MDFEEKYELPEGLTTEHAGTFRARERSSRIEVLVHFLGMRGESERVKEQVNALPPAARRQVIEFGDYNGRPFVVTECLAQPLKDWLEASAGSGGEKPVRDSGRAGAWKLPVLPQVSESHAVPAAEPGAFTQMFQAPPLPSDTQAMPLPPAASPHVGAPLSAAPSGDGEFTRVFRVAAAARVSALPPVASPQTTPVTDPGGFTRMFQSRGEGETFVPPPSSLPVTHPAPLAPAPAAGAGEFTRMFQAPSGPAPRMAAELTSALAAPSAPAASTPASPAYPILSSGDATGAFAGTRPPYPAAPLTGPSEYTRMISVMPPGPSAAAVPSSETTPPAGRKKSLNIALLVAIFEGVIILALVLILFFALKKSP